MAFTNGKDLPVGGIFNHGMMKLTDSVVTSNQGVETAGGIDNDIDGTLTMSRTQVNDNQSTGPNSGRGGGLFNVGTASVTDSTISNNSALIGGGVENSGKLLITNSELINNKTPTTGGALGNRSIFD